MAKLIKWIAAVSVLMTVILSVLWAKTSAGLLLTLAITAGTVAYHFLMRLVVGWVVDRIMGNRADPYSGWFTVRPFEQQLYRLMGVRRWKKYVPSYDPSAFSLKAHTWDEIAQTMCQSEIVHEVIAVLSFLPIAAAFWFGEFWVFFFTSVMAACLDLVFVVVQRYNRPRVLKMII